MSGQASIRNLFTHGAGQIINLLAPFLVALYVIPVCGVAHWGIVSVVTSLYILIGLLVEFGANLIGVKELSAHRASLKYVQNYISLNYRYRLICCVLVTLALLGIFLILEVDQAYYWGLTWMAAWYYNPLWIYQAEENFKKINKIIFLSKALYILSIFIFIRHTGDYIYVAGLLGVCNSLVYGWYYYRVPKKKTALKRVRVFIKQNKSIVVSNFAINCYTQAPVFIIDAVLGNTATGIFKIIDLFLTAFRSYLGVFFNVTYPRFCSLMATGKQPARRYAYTMTTGNLAFLAVAVAVIVLILPLFLDYFDFSEEIRQGLKYSSYLLFLPVVIALNIPFYQVLLFTKQNGFIVATSVMGLALTVILGIFLTRRYGLWGVCITMYAVEVFITMRFLLKGKKSLGIHE